MPFTPFHWGPSSWVGLLLFRFINFGAFLVASVIIDVEPFCVLVFNLHYPLHGFLHSFLGGTIAAVLFSMVAYRSQPLTNRVLKPFRLAQDSTYGVILFSCLLGVYFHIFLDSFLYTDIRPFFPLSVNPFYGWVSLPLMYLFCAASFFIGGLFYAMKWNQGKWAPFFKAVNIVVFLGFVIVMFLLCKETTQFPFGQLAKIQREIDSKVYEVYKTGQDAKINITFADEGILVISPPYADISGVGKKAFNAAVLMKMQSFVNSQETGHLFYIKQGHLADHRLLSGLAEPVLGIKSKKEIVLLISRKPTSGRPVRIEILNQ